MDETDFIFHWRDGYWLSGIQRTAKQCRYSGLHGRGDHERHRGPFVYGHRIVSVNQDVAVNGVYGEASTITYVIN